jgi:putative redox protein
MTSELLVRSEYEGGMRVRARSGPHEVLTDYPLPGAPAELQGMRPLELLLASLSACAASTVALLLARMKEPAQGLEVQARATRRDEHPTVLTSIHLEFVVKGNGVSEASVARALAQAGEHLCPVWAMLKPGTPISTSIRVLSHQA